MQLQLRANASSASSGSVRFARVPFRSVRRTCSERVIIAACPPQANTTSKKRRQPGMYSVRVLVLATRVSPGHNHHLHSPACCVIRLNWWCSPQPLQRQLPRRRRRRPQCKLTSAFLQAIYRYLPRANYCSTRVLRGEPSVNAKSWLCRQAGQNKHTYTQQGKLCKDLGSDMACSLHKFKPED